MLAQEAREVDNTGTIANADRFENYRKVQRERQERQEALAAQGLATLKLEFRGKSKNDSFTF